MKIKVNIVGNVFGTSGFSSHTRQLAGAMEDTDLDVGLELGSMEEGWQQRANEKWIKMVNAKYQEEGTIMITMPEFTRFKMNERLPFLIPFVVFEGDKIHKSWTKILNDDRITCIFVPSTHTQNALIKGGVKKKIHVIPHGVDTKLFNPKVEPLKEFTSDKFTFMYVGGWSQGKNDRKGLDILLKAFTEEFKKDEPVRLFVKINPCYNAPNWNLKDEIEKLKLKDVSKRPSVEFLTDAMPYNIMPNLYKCADVLVSPSKAEGFNLPCLEAMACGVPCIVSNFGGHTDFVDNKNGWLVSKGKMKPATDANWFYEETNWFNVDIKSLRKKLRLAYNSKQIKKKGELSRKTAEKFTWNASAKKVSKILSKL